MLVGKAVATYNCAVLLVFMFIVMLCPFNYLTEYFFSVLFSVCAKSFQAFSEYQCIYLHTVVYYQRLLLVSMINVSLCSDDVYLSQQH